MYLIAPRPFLSCSQHISGCVAALILAKWNKSFQKVSLDMKPKQAYNYFYKGLKTQNLFIEKKLYQCLSLACFYQKIC